MALPATDVPPWMLPVVTLVVSPLLTAMWIRRAHRLQLLDTPERRRLHDAPTPRGGGIGPVTAIAVAIALAGSQLPDTLGAFKLPLLFGLLSAAAISLLDDHRPLSIAARLGVHSLAATLVVIAFIDAQGWAGKYWVEGGIVLIGAVVASMNLHNFMDGSDAHLGSQSMFVFTALTLLAGQRGAMELGSLFAAAAVAMLAFLPFNWPRARVFLGDVGSISLGFLVAAFSLVAIDRGLVGWGGALILSSGFMIDASATLVGRMRRTRHWMWPHRDHLYQWLWRCGWSSARVVVVYQAWNLLVVLPALLIMERYANSLLWEFVGAIAVYAAGLVLWAAARRALWRTHRAQYRP